MLQSGGVDDHGTNMTLQRATARTATRAKRILSVAIIAALGTTVPVHAIAAAQRSGAVALRDQLRTLMPAAPKAPGSPAATLVVSSCADDGAPGTLRSVVAASGEDDTVDLAALQCGTITLSQGAIPVLLNSLAIAGPGAAALSIDGAGADRVFIHPGGGTLALGGVTVRNGAARVAGSNITGGGCIASAGYVLLDHSVVSDCYSSGEGVYGGAVFAYGLTMVSSTLTRNVGFAALPDTGTATFGGGAYVGTVNLVDSTVSANRAAHDLAQGGYVTGGGLFTNTGGTITASTIEGNDSDGIGGGVSVFGGSLSVVNSTISGNVAQTRGGGGIDARATYAVSIANSTIADNRATAGGGVYLRAAAPTLDVRSSLLAGNTAATGADIGSINPVTVGGANDLIVSAGPGVTLPPGTLHADPRLQALADNGGPTRTRALSSGSPALDAGNNLSALATDQRGPGFPRVIGAAPDIGAFEGTAARPRAATAVPALSSPGLVLSGLLLALLGLAVLRRRRGVS